MSGDRFTATRQRLEMQGFSGCDVPTLRAIRPWLRVGPAICGIWMVMGLISGSATALWVLAPLAASGAILPVHPFDLPYNIVIRRRTGTPPIPSYGAPRRFTCALAALWVSATAWALAVGATGNAYALGMVFMASPAIYVTTDFCMGSWMYRQWRVLSHKLLLDRSNTGVA